MASLLAAQQTETLHYRVEWHLIVGGTAALSISAPKPNAQQIDLQLESAGVVSKLYRVYDTYQAKTDSNFCGVSSTLDAQEGKRHRVSRLTFDNNRHKLTYQEHDMLKNTNVDKELDIPACAHEIAGAMNALRLLKLDAGKSTTLAITDGKKLVNAKIQGGSRENITIDGKNYKTISYEAFVFDNVLYQRKGSLTIWITDDAERIPVQIRVRLGFPVYNITLYLDKYEKK